MQSIGGLGRRTFGLFSLLIASGLSAACAGELTVGVGTGGAPSSTEESTNGETVPPGTHAEFPGAPLEEASKLDLLLVVDNSLSMDEAQRQFRKGVRALLKRLSARVSDIHVGVISTSLGGDGVECQSAPEQNDRAHLIPTVRGLSSYEGSGFSKWDPNQSADPPGLSEEQAFLDEVDATLASVGTTGCGYEASLEAWYRFLDDPEPSESVGVDGVPQGLDETLLEQRARFLRPDSALAIVLVSDENDCSFRDASKALISRIREDPALEDRFPPPTSQCASDPNDPCCRSCDDLRDIPGCPKVTEDRACVRRPALTEEEDPLNVRCWDSKRRFGVDLLYPMKRYVDALTSPVLPGRSQALLPNPLFVEHSGKSRRPGLVTFAALVGVPLEDIVPEGDAASETPRVLSAAELTREDRWPLFTGSAPQDPFMIESVDPRTGVHPLSGAPLSRADAVPPSFNPINGHEDLAKDRLESACISRLEEPEEACGNFGTCNCTLHEAYNAKFPYCRDPETLSLGDTQYFAFATPGLRPLTVLKGLGASAVVGSVCAQRATPPTSEEGGYASSFRALEDRLATLLK